MITRSAKLPLPIHFFCPSSTQLSPSRRAVVRRPRATSEPASGSVSPKAPSSSMRAIAGSQRCFCSSDPQRYTVPIASPPCTPMNVAIDGSPRESSMAIMPSSNDDFPGQP
jgi:hypothetical protein